MKGPALKEAVRRVDESRIAEHLFHLSRDPLPRRTAALTLPGHAASTLREADAYIGDRLRASGFAVEEQECRVRAYGRDISKPLSQQYAAPDPLSPRLAAYNVIGERKGAERPEEVILLVSHKDSQSWIDSPGASDNATGTSANLELARVAGSLPLARTLRFLFCNEEHNPWTSRIYAESIRRRGDDLVAVYNLDSLGSKSREELLEGRKTLVSRFCRPEGAPFAELVGRMNDELGIGLRHRTARIDSPSDDDGSFVLAGWPMAVMEIGSVPNAYPHYHAETDVPENVDVANVRMAAQAVLGAILALDQPDRGAPR